MRAQVREAVLGSDAVLTPSAWLRRVAVEALALPASARVDVVPNFVDPEAFHPLDDGAGEVPALFPDLDWSPRGRPAVLLHASNFRPVKRVGDAVRALAEVRRRRPAVLVLVGDGPERAAAEALAVSLGVRGGGGLRRRAALARGPLRPRRPLPAAERAGELRPRRARVAGLGRPGGGERRGRSAGGGRPRRDRLARAAPGPGGDGGGGAEPARRPGAAGGDGPRRPGLGARAVPAGPHRLPGGGDLPRGPRPAHRPAADPVGADGRGSRPGTMRGSVLGGGRIRCPRSER